MQSASSLNHTDEGNSLCNENFFPGFLAFLSFDELQNWQRGASGASTATHSFVLSKGKENGHVLGSLECH